MLPFKLVSHPNIVENDQLYGIMIQDFNQICTSPVLSNSMDILNFTKKLSVEYTTILPEGADYGKFKIVHDGLYKCIYFPNHQISHDSCENYRCLLRLDKNWRTKEAIFGAVNFTSIAGGYTNSILDLQLRQSNCVQLTTVENLKNSLEEVFADLFRTSNMLFLSLDLVGSMANNLCFLESSDVDLVLQVISDLQNHSLSDSIDSVVFQKAQDVLPRHGFRVIDMVINARVPVLKLEHSATQMQVDLCVNNTNSKRNTALIKSFLGCDGRVRPLVLAVKHWAKQRGVCNPRNSTLTSYCWVIMTIFFLQQCQPPVLPVINLVEVDGECIHDIQPLEETNTDSLGELLLKFFLFFGSVPSTDFNPFLQIISIRTNEIHSKRWRKHEIPTGDTPLGKRVVPWWRFCVEDPIELSHDLGGVIGRYEGQVLIFTEMHRAYLIMTGKNSEGVEVGDVSFHHICEANTNIPLLPMICSQCGSTEHSVNYCPQTRCRGCGGRGHITRLCPNKVCFYCRGPHLVSQCPERRLAGTVAVVDEEDYDSDRDILDMDVVTPAVPKRSFRDLFEDSDSLIDASNTGRTKGLLQLTHSISHNSMTAPVCNSYIFRKQVLSWTVHQFMNPKLFSLRSIPDVFENSEDFFPSFFPFVVEEARAQIEAVAMKHFDGIGRYKASIICDYVSDGKFFGNGDDLLDIFVIVQPGMDWDKVKNTGPSFALFVKNPPDELTVERLYSLPHVLVDMGFQKPDSDGSSHVQFRSTIRNIPTAIDLLVKPESNWFLYLLDVGSIAAARICDALSRKEQPSFMADIYSAKDTPTNGSDRPLGNSSQSWPFTTKLNESQRNAVKNILNVGSYGIPKIQLVKGPPGTGKTSTLVALLMSLKACGKTIHASAPTNVAVCELARRSLQAFASLDSQERPRSQDRLADFLLIGTRDRLKIETEGDPLNDILFDVRVQRLKEAVECFPRECSSFLSYFHRLEYELASDDTRDKKHTYSKEEMEALNTLADAFKLKTSLLQSHLQTLYHEAPIAMLAATGLKYTVMQTISSIFSSILSWDNISLGKWLASKKTLESGQINGNASLGIAKDLLKNINVKKPKNLKGDVFKEAQLVFSTVNVGGREIFDFASFDVTIIDEATQLVQAETCIVLRQRLRCLVLVGDDKQLPSTVISNQCSAKGYNQSLFGRLLASKYPFRLLDIQYRMHPDISRWPRGQFYDGLVVNGENVMSDQYRKDWHKILPPFALYDVESGEEETHVHGSKFNEAEAMVVRQIVSVIRGLQLGALVVGIISPYSEQVAILQHLETKSDKLTLRVSTVDGFQGQECDIIIFTAVRSNDRREIGFLKDERRLNVAVTRAKYSLVVVGSVSTLSSDATWESLINHAREQNCYYNSTNCSLIRKCSNKWNVSEQRIKDTLSPKSSVFESLPWKVVFNDELRNTVAKADIPLRTAIIKAILKLGNGEWPKFELTNPLVPEKYKQVIHVHRVILYRLVWSVDVCQVTCTQILKLWNAVLPNMLPQAIQRVGSILDRYTSDYLGRCATKSQMVQNYVPTIWSTSIPFNWYQSSSQREGGQAVGDSVALERSHVNNSAVLMKFYPLSSAVARLLVAMKSGQTIQLPFVMSKEEESIVRHPGSAFILGRSGTGKTTAILHRMFLESAYSKMLTEDISKDDTIHRQLMVTASPILCEAIRRSYQNMCQAASLAEHGSPVGICDDSTKVTVSTASSDLMLQGDKESKLPGSLRHCGIEFFPLILTYKDLLRLLDGTLARSFFAQHQSNKLNKMSMSSARGDGDSDDSDEDEGEKGFPSMRRTAQDSIGCESLPGVEVDYDRFSSHYFPRFNETLTSEASVVYTEIMSHIKGSLQALHSEKGRLSREEYRQLSQQRQSSLSEKQRDRIYDAFEKYERLKSQEYRDYDTLDVVHHVYSTLSLEGYRGVTVDSVYVDEVQDLTPAEITLFKFISENPRGFVFAGDTAQTIAHGVGFRFETVKDIFYSEYLKGGDMYADTELMPKIWHLKQNFRTHAAVVNIANSIVELIVRFFPLSIDRLEPESSQVHGPLPIFIDSTDNLVVDLFQNNSATQSCQFGAEQVILVRDDVTKREVLEISGNRALVLTVLEAKGMEFTDCLVYNFFASSPCGNDWRVIYNAFESAESCPTFDIQKHNLLCLELKSLYVLITRAKQNLILYDSAYVTRQPMLSFWRQKGLVELKPLDDNIRSVFQTSSSSEEWVQRGAQLFERKQFSNARLCYQRAGDGQMEKLCHGYELEQEADHLAVRLPFESKKVYLNAATVFGTVVGQTLSVARCYDKAGEFLKAARCYKDISKHSDAGRCFQAAEHWHDAAISYNDAGAVDPALKCCYKVFDFDSALAFLDGARNSQKMGQEWIKKHHKECTLKAATYYHSHHNPRRMMEFVVRFAMTNEKRLFLKRNNYYDRLLEIEIFDECFSEAAQIYEDWYDFRKAAEYYDRALRPGDSLRCTLRAVRLHVLDADYMMTAKLSEVDVELLQQLQGKVDGDHTQLEIELMLASTDASTPVAVWKALCQRTKSLSPFRWRLHYLATRLTLRRLVESKCSEDVAEHCREMLSVLDQIGLSLERLKEQGTPQYLSRSDKELVGSCMEAFEWTLEGNNHMSKNLTGPNNPSGLTPIFQVSDAAPANSSSSSSDKNYKATIRTIKISIKEFSQSVLKYFSELRKRAVVETLVALNFAYRSSASAAMSMETYSTRLAVVPSKRQTVQWTTSIRLQLLLDCHSIIQASTPPTDMLRHPGHKKLRADLVDLVVHSRPRLEDVDQLVSARSSSEVLSMLRTYRESDLSQTGLKYNLIALSLHLAEVTGDISRVTETLIKNIENELTNRKQDVFTQKCVNYVLLRLIQAYKWESADYEEIFSHFPNYLGGSFFHSIRMGLLALKNEVDQGEIGQLLLGKPKDRLRNGCFSPQTFLQLVEKYFVLLLCHLKMFRDVLLPYSLAKDVLCRRSKACREAVQRYSSTQFYQENTGPYYTEILNLVYMLLSLLEKLTDTSFDNWEDGNSTSGTHSSQSVKDSLEDFIMRILSIIIIYIINRPHDINNNTNFCYRISQLHCRNYLPYFFKLFVWKLSMHTVCFMYTKFCSDNDQQPPLLLHCISTTTTLPNWCIYPKKYPLTRAVLAVGEEDEIRIIPPTEIPKSDISNTDIDVAAVDTSTSASPQALEENPDNLDQQHSGEASAATDQNSSMFAIAPTLIHKLTAEEQAAQLLSKYHPPLTFQLQQARSRLQRLSPLTRLLRVVERELLDVGWRRTSPEAIEYTSLLCPYRLLFQEWYDAVETFLQAAETKAVATKVALEDSECLYHAEAAKEILQKILSDLTPSLSLRDKREGVIATNSNTIITTIPNNQDMSAASPTSGSPWSPHIMKLKVMSEEAEIELQENMAIQRILSDFKNTTTTTHKSESNSSNSYRSSTRKNQAYHGTATATTGASQDVSSAATTSNGNSNAPHATGNKNHRKKKNRK